MCVEIICKIIEIICKVKCVNLAFEWTRKNNKEKKGRTDNEK